MFYPTGRLRYHVLMFCKKVLWPLFNTFAQEQQLVWFIFMLSIKILYRYCKSINKKNSICGTRTVESPCLKNNESHKQKGQILRICV